MSASSTDDATAQAFIAKWSGSTLSERSTFASFATELCALLGVDAPDGTDTAYAFERRVDIYHPATAKTTPGYIDLYKRGCFVLEAKKFVAAEPFQPELTLKLVEAEQKKSGVRRDTAAWDSAMLKARGQAENYARSLPAEEDPPVFLLVVDIGHAFELYADFSQKGKAYQPFPDARTYRLRLADLAKPAARERLRTIWTDPGSLDPAKKAAEVTREVAGHLAELAKLFEQDHDPATVAAFLSRCLFCMFAEDVDLLPRDSFTGLLDSVKDDPGAAVPLLKALFEEMNRGGTSLVLRKTLLQFNGGLFAEATVLPLDALKLGLLRRAARLEWRHVEPAIFGTLLERALDKNERHKLGAHYTPRAYVERLVLPTVIEPLRDEWTHIRAEAVRLAHRGDLKGAIKTTRDFHHRLCTLRVLDPACGSGNFLYVTLELLKRLEGEVLELAESFGENMRLDLLGETVDPHQFLGIEINPRAATIAELVLWIGFLQWHHRNRGSTEWPEPVLKKFANIECRDAVLAYDKREYAKDAAGNIRYEWDRRTMKVDPVTGRNVPDESAVKPVDVFINPRPATWPEADYVVGNPPFIGGWTMRQTLGEGYIEALWSTYPKLPEKADFVMYWWHKAALLTRESRASRFGFITTNSITQTFQRRVLEHHLLNESPLKLVYAIPDHPWVDAADGAAVRIAMTVAATGTQSSLLAKVAKETGEDVTLATTETTTINPNLSVGVDVSQCTALQANDGVSSPGVQLYGDGFIVSAAEAKRLRESARSDAARSVIRDYINGKDFMHRSRGVSVIDFFGLTLDEARSLHPQAFEIVLAEVKPVRDQNRRESIRKLWWRFGWERPVWRDASRHLSRFIVTTETSKHRVFAFLDSTVLPDNMLTGIATDDAFHLGVLSSRIHIVFSLATGGRLGVGNDPRYNKTRCFDPFPFPDCTEIQKQRIRDLAEQIDAHRKRAQADHGLGLTDIYNVLEKVRAGTAFTAKDKQIHAVAMVATLRHLHDELDAAVAEAYGWPWPLSDEEILERVVALNTKRAAEEAEGHIRWLRPDYQKPLWEAKQRKGKQSTLALGDSVPANRKSRIQNPKSKKHPWPKTGPERSKAIHDALAAESAPVTPADLAQRFARAKTDDVREILQTLTTLGLAHPGDQPDTWLK